MVQCKLCKIELGVITNTHLKSRHGIDIKEYKSRFGYEGVGFAVNVVNLPHDDPRYIKWRESLFVRPAPWSKGHTKETHPSVAKISKTFKEKGIDNFAGWRKEAKEQGLIPSSYPAFKKSKTLAFLIGMILGDGNIFCFPRTEGLRIALGTDKPALWQYTRQIVKEVFKKEPYVYKVKGSECMVISIYQKEISKRLGIPHGSRNNINVKLPRWIWQNKEFLIACLRGLYEAEGSFNVHKPTYTYKIIFSNRNDTLLDNVYNGLKILGFHPHRSKYKIQISKKKEVYDFKNLIDFRNYI